jgi:hypothetical protein
MKGDLSMKVLEHDEEGVYVVKKKALTLKDHRGQERLYSLVLVNVRFLDDCFKLYLQ